MDLSFLYKQGEFNAFTVQHWMPIIVISVIGIAIVAYGKLILNESQNWRCLFIISLLPAFGYVWMLCSVLYDGSFKASENLPIHICRLLAIITPFIIWKRNRFFMGIIYFWIMVGTLNAVITPDIEFGFPHWNYFTYWLIHAFLIIIPIYYVVVLRIRIKLKDLWNAFLAGNIYLLFSMGINKLLGSNYMYSLEKPESATLLDYLGPWPFYLLTAQGIAIVFFILAYLPFYFLDNSKKNEALG